MPETRLKLLLESGNERCGIILDDDEIVELPNISTTPDRAFEIDPAQMLVHLTSGRLTGTWHTHPDADPNLSEEDRVCFQNWPNLVHYIVGRRNKEPTVVKYVVEDGFLLQCE